MRGRKGEVKSATFRTLLRMLLSGTGMSIVNTIRKSEAVALIRELAGPHAHAHAVDKRNSGIGALASLLTSYTGKEVSFEDAANCFYNPIHRGLMRTRRLDKILGGRPWPPCTPSSERLREIATGAVRVNALVVKKEDALLTQEAEDFIQREISRIDRIGNL